MRTSLVLALAFLLVGPPLSGQIPSLTAHVDTTLISVGDRITFQVSVDHPPESRVVWPDSLDLGPIEVLTGRAGPPISRGEMIRSTLALTLTAFELGDLEIPSFPVEILDAGGESTILHTNPFGIRVSSVGLDEGEDIRQLKGPLGIPLGLGRMFLMILGVLLTLTGAYLLFRRMRREDPESPTPLRTLPARPPHEVALEALRRLEASPLLEHGKIKDFHIQASDILRVYVEGRFGVAALEMTTSDITGGLERAGVELGVVEDFRSFLTRCDMVKFAKNRPSQEESGTLLNHGRTLVEETIPTSNQPETAQSEAEAGASGAEATRSETEDTGSEAEAKPSEARD